MHDQTKAVAALILGTWTNLSLQHQIHLFSGIIVRLDCSRLTGGAAVGEQALDKEEDWD